LFFLETTYPKSKICPLKPIFSRYKGVEEGKRFKKKATICKLIKKIGKTDLF
jgi:hypothetical protein